MRPAAPDSPTPLLIVSGWAGGDTRSVKNLRLFIVTCVTLRLLCALCCGERGVPRPCESHLAALARRERCLLFGRSCNAEVLSFIASQVGR
eukprot:320339-Pyramimonas_sp.AAC.1